MDSLRLFIAVEIPAEVRRRLAEIEQQLMAARADVKWVPEGNFHITLKFLGNVEASRVQEISAAVESAVKDVPAFETEMIGVGAFPNIRRPNVIWVGIRSGGDQFRALAERIEAAMEPLGFIRESRPFSPHITVGRSRSPQNSGKLSELVESLREENAGAFGVKAVSIMKSDLRPAGPVYTRIASIELK